MGYQEEMEAAGAKVLNFWSFGSYQGEWVAQVEYEGKTGFVEGYYGSCSGCDAFEAEFGYSDHKNPGYQKRLAEFGRNYLGDIQPLEAILKHFYDNAKWDSDAAEAVKTLEPLLEGKGLDGSAR